MKISFKVYYIIALSSIGQNFVRTRRLLLLHMILAINAQESLLTISSIGGRIFKKYYNLDHSVDGGIKQ